MSEGIFNVAALFVLLRESLEAALIVGVLLNYIKKTHSHDLPTAKKLKRCVWYGAGAGLVLSIIVGVIITVIFYVLKNDVFGDAAVSTSRGHARGRPNPSNARVMGPRKASGSYPSLVSRDCRIRLLKWQTHEWTWFSFFSYRLYTGTL
jgi:hypothetical protein